MVVAQSPRRCTRAPKPITPEHALQSIATLRRINDDRMADQNAVVLLRHDDTDDDADSPSPVYDSYLNSDAESVHTMTNFAPLEFKRLWGLVGNHLTMNWNTGRDRKSAYNAKDVLFMTLTVLKNCGKWDVVAPVFKVKSPAFQEMVTKFASVLSPCLYETMVASALDSDTADIDIFHKNAEFHLQALRKVEGGGEIEDEGHLIAQYPTSWTVLANKGYQGLASDFRAITPYKRAPLQTLTLEQQRYRENRRNRIDMLFVLHRERESRSGARSNYRESPGVGALHRPTGGRARRPLEATQAASDSESSSDEVALPINPPVV
ncbi:unnamed protein product [Phytophthora fragariaefolia]|uniref:Unnamed protein product n=1 Tax=Phytophthora fragariaefolia TaxID=1490495 RepID=A0A9W6WQ06_9STRA|nr:unnamed protein product [Phytophthora fragariaefolia]